jgi:hypothetical protein
LKAKDDAAKGFPSGRTSRVGSRGGSSAADKRTTNVSWTQNVLGVPGSETTAAATKGTLPEIKQNMRRLGASAASDDDVKDLPDLTRLMGSPRQSPKKDSVLGSDGDDLDQYKINIKDGDKRGAKHRGLDFVKLNRRIVYPNAYKFAGLSNSIDETSQKRNLMGSPIQQMPLSVRDSNHKAAIFRSKILESANDINQQFLSPGQQDYH